MSDELGMSAEERVHSALALIERGAEYRGEFRPVPYRTAIEIAEAHARAAVEAEREQFAAFYAAGWTSHQRAEKAERELAAAREGAAKAQQELRHIAEKIGLAEFAEGVGYVMHASPEEIIEYVTGLGSAHTDVCETHAQLLQDIGEHLDGRCECTCWDDPDAGCQHGGGHHEDCYVPERCLVCRIADALERLGIVANDAALGAGTEGGGNAT